ncbi:MAG: hypothetical protein U0797_13060 [Gemmataceae bacterium]
MSPPASAAPNLRGAARGLLLAYVALSPVVFWYGLVEPFESCKSALTQLTAVALAVLGVASGGLRWADLRGLFRGPVGLAVLCGALSATASTALSISPRTSLQGALDSGAGLGSALALATLFAAGRSLCRGGPPPGGCRAPRCRRAGSLSCAYALVQAAGPRPGPLGRPGSTAAGCSPTAPGPYLAGAVLALPAVLWLRAWAAGHGQRAAAQARGRRPHPLLAATAVVLSLSRSRVASPAGWPSLCCSPAGGGPSAATGGSPPARLPDRVRAGGGSPRQCVKSALRAARPVGSSPRPAGG